MESWARAAPDQVQASSVVVVSERAIQMKRELAGEPLAFAFRTLSAALRHYGHHPSCPNVEMRAGKRVHTMPPNVCACWGDLWRVFQQQGHEDILRREKRFRLIAAAPHMAKLLISFNDNALAGEKYLNIPIIDGGPTPADVEAVLREAGVIE